MEERGDLEDLGVVGGCQNGFWRGGDGSYVLDSPGSVQEQVATYHELGYEPLGTIKLVACDWWGFSQFDWCVCY